MKTLLLYTPIFSFVSKEFVNNLNQIPENEDVIVRVNSPGGSVFAGWSLIAALKDRSGKFNMKVDGSASSMAFYMALFADNVEALDVTHFMVHRADGYVETQEDKDFLATINKDLRAKMEKRINPETFKSVTGVSFDEIFDAEKRIDVNITAKQAKKIGLVHSITRLDPEKFAAFNKQFVGFCDNITNEEVITPAAGPKKEKVESKKKNPMNKEEFKAAHATEHASIVSEGVTIESARVKAWMAFLETDPKAVKEGIENGKSVDMAVIAEMSVKAIAKAKAGAIENDSPEGTPTPKEETPETIAAKEEAKFLAEMNDAAGIKKVEETK